MWEVTLRIATVEVFLNNFLNDWTKIAVLSLEAILIFCNKFVKIVKQHPVEHSPLRMGIKVIKCCYFFLFQLSILKINQCYQRRYYTPIGKIKIIFWYHHWIYSINMLKIIAMLLIKIKIHILLATICDLYARNDIKKSSLSLFSSYDLFKQKLLLPRK